MKTEHSYIESLDKLASSLDDIGKRYEDIINALSDLQSLFKKIDETIKYTERIFCLKNHFVVSVDNYFYNPNESSYFSYF
jgi:uncharacterized protein Smg (DUF494 family)